MILTLVFKLLALSFKKAEKSSLAKEVELAVVSPILTDSDRHVPSPAGNVRQGKGMKI